MSNQEPPSNPSRRSFVKYVAAGVAIAAIGGAAGGYYEYLYLPSQRPKTVSVGSSSAETTDACLTAAKEQGLFTANKLSPTFNPFSDLATAMNAFLSNQFEFHWDANIPASANARAKGVKVQGIVGSSIATNAIIVKGDSPYQTINDLKGKTIGTFLLPSLSVIIAAEVWNKNNPSSPIDPLNDFKFSNSAPPVLNQQLLSGQLDAIETIDPFVSSGITSGARILAQPYEDWKTLTGGTMFGAVLGVQQSYAESNVETTKEMVKTMIAAQNYVVNNASFFDNFVKTTYNFTDQNLINTLQQRANAVLTPVTWNDSLISNLNQFLQLLQKYNIVTSTPTDLFTAAYVP